MNFVERLRSLLGIRPHVAAADTELIYVYLPEDLDPLDRGARYEDALDTELKMAGIGHVSGGGSLLGDELEDGTRPIVFCGIDVDVRDLAAGRGLLRDHLPALGCPPGTALQYSEGEQRLQDEFDGSAWTLAQPRSHHPRGEGPRVGPGVAVGIDEAMIRDLVHAFYGRVREDNVLGPIFDRAIGEDWDVHLAKLCDFWSSVMLATGRFQGRPMQAHNRLPDIRSAHFGRWLALFEATARDVCPPDAAALFVERARMIGRSLEMGLAVSRGELPPLRRPA
eukprot:gene13014-12794_t